MSERRAGDQLLYCAFNQDSSCFSIGTRDGYRIFHCDTGSPCFEKNDGATSIVEMLFCSSLVAIVGAGEQPTLSPRRLCMFNTTTGNTVVELSFVTSILAVRMNQKRLVVVLHQKAFIYDLANMIMLETLETVPNTRGLCALSVNAENCLLALPASINSGAVLVYNALNLHTYCQGQILEEREIVAQPSTVPRWLLRTLQDSKLQALLKIQAHHSPLAAIAISSDGSLLATASEHGTVVRVFIILEATKAYTFRRGSYPATIYSLSFGPASQVPQLLVATSSSGTVHVFKLHSEYGPRGRAASLLAAVLPNSVSGSGDSEQCHLTIRNVLPPGVKSVCSMACHAQETAEGGSSEGPQSNSYRARLFLVTMNGYFSEYNVKVGPGKENSWTLERECSIKTSCSDQISVSFV